MCKSEEKESFQTEGSTHKEVLRKYGRHDYVRASSSVWLVWKEKSKMAPKFPAS